MADVKTVIDGYKLQGSMTRTNYDEIIEVVQADGFVDKNEGEQLNRLFELIKSGEIVLTDGNAAAGSPPRQSPNKQSSKTAQTRSSASSATFASSATSASSATCASRSRVVQADVPKRKGRDKLERLTAADMTQYVPKEEAAVVSEPTIEAPTIETRVQPEPEEQSKPVSFAQSSEEASSQSSASSERGVLGSNAGNTKRVDLSASSSTGPAFELASSRFLRINLSSSIWMKVGSMVAYTGNVKFTRESVFEHGIIKTLKRGLTGEGTDLSRAEGTGVLYLADHGKMITLYKLYGDTIVVNGKDLFAFERSISWDISSMKRLAALWAGGCFNVTLSGSGTVAITTHFDPVTVRVHPNRPVFTDPDATVAWSGSLIPTIKADISSQTMIGRTSGETFQLRFEGDGDVLIQPFQEGVKVS